MALVDNTCEIVVVDREYDCESYVTCMQPGQLISLPLVSMNEGSRCSLDLLQNVCPSHVVQDPRYGSAILLVRDPADVIVAEWQRKKAKSHRQSVGIEFFGRRCRRFTSHHII